MGSSGERSSRIPHQDSASTHSLVKINGVQGGAGDDSYAHNSTLQNYNFHTFAKPYLAQAIDCLLHRPATATIRIADLGCANGRNALEYAEFIVEQVVKGNDLAPEIQYFFSDLPQNDFNSLFQIVAPCGKEVVGKEIPKFYVAGVPGSFYNQLFPKSSLDFAICAYAMHWLSQVPPEVLDKTSPAWNGGHIWIHGERPNVAKAYARQFQSDVKTFLKCRAAELAEGGILFLVCLSRAKEHPTGDYNEGLEGVWCGCFESAWDEMVSEGVVDAEERDTFNLPQYNFHRAELQAALKDVPELELVKLEVAEDTPNMPEKELQQLLSNPQKFADLWTMSLMSVVKPMVQTHIGEQRTAELSKRLHRIVKAHASSVKKQNIDAVLAVLRRN